MKAKDTGYLVSGMGHLLLVLWGVLAFSFAKPVQIEDSIPVEIVSELPETKQGEKAAEKPLDTPKKVDVVKPKPPEDNDDDTPVAKEKVKTAEAVPLPPPLVAPQKVEPPKKPAPKPEPVKKAEPPKPAPPVKQKLAALENEDLEAKLAELAAKQKKDKEAKEKAEKALEKAAKEKATKDAKEKADKEEAAQEAKEAKEKAVKDKAAKELAAQEAKEKALKDSKERLEARKFDPDALKKKLGSSAALTDTRPAARTENAGEKTAPKASAGAQQGRNSTLTASETAAIKAKIEGCWNTASLSINAKNFVVKVQFTMDENGNVTGSPVVTNRQAGTEFAAAAGSAVRAVRGCSPLPVPKNKYDAWKEGISLTFNLADLL